MSDMDKIICEIETTYYPVQSYSDEFPDNSLVKQTLEWIRKNKTGRVFQYDDKYWFENEKDRLHYTLRWHNEDRTNS